MNFNMCVHFYMKHAGPFSLSSCALGFINQCSDMKLHFYFSSYGCHHYHCKLRHTAPTPTSFITRLLFSLLLFVSLSPLLPPFPAQEVMSHWKCENVKSLYCFGHIKCIFKRNSSPKKIKICPRLLTLMLFQACMRFILWDYREIMKTVLILLFQAITV